MAAIDVANQSGEFALEIAVRLDSAARGRRDLQQRHRAGQRRLNRPHAIERMDTVDQPLGIVEPIDADRELLAAEASPQPRDVRMRDRLGGLLGESQGVDADRKHGDMRATVPRAHNPIVNDEIQNRFDVGKEILAVVPGLESDKIVGQHRFD